MLTLNVSLTDTKLVENAVSSYSISINGSFHLILFICLRNILHVLIKVLIMLNSFDSPPLLRSDYINLIILFNFDYYAFIELGILLTV